METLGKTLEQNTDIPLQNWAGRTSLQELSAIIARAHILVGNETSAVHIAAAVSTPSVCTLGEGTTGGLYLTAWKRRQKSHYLLQLFIKWFALGVIGIASIVSQKVPLLLAWKKSR